MKLAAQLVSQVEQALAHRHALPFSPRVRSEESTAFGIAGLDAVVACGIPQGAITELVGPPCSGRTTAALTFLASMTRTGNVCAWIDVSDSLDPESAAANGVDLERLLWVRCSSKPGATVEAEPEAAPGLLSSAIAPSMTRHTGGCSPHPRAEGRDMPEAINAMLRAHGGLYDKEERRHRKKIGTPGMPNRPFSEASTEREEQVNSDRLPPRRGANLTLAPRCAEPQPRRVAQRSSEERMPLELAASKKSSIIANKPWQALDQALRAADLLLQAGGFSTIVLDLGNVPPEAAWRIPMATWFRFRAACERTRVSLLLLTTHSCARSSAGLVVGLQPGSMEVQGRVMTGVRYAGQTERVRSRDSEAHLVTSRKPQRSAHENSWVSEAAWARAK